VRARKSDDAPAHNRDAHAAIFADRSQPWARHNGRMHEWERRKILGQWGVRGENARERREREILERELAGAPFRHRRVRPRAHPFGRSPESYVASLGGPLPYMVRLREIAEETQAHERALEVAWRDLAGAAGRDAPGFARRWRAVAARWNFTAVNELIERHNRYYPAEARLPMDPRTRDFALVNGEPYRKRLLDSDWVLERFPPVLAVARAAA
jgi:hypothetical protein